ncbi:MAG TPA: catalase family peroxidase [Polyangia bacterium]|jgi:catalase|nr:catalase family peroxidase [Polyangia bacterium]
MAANDQELPVLPAIQVMEESTGAQPGYRRAHARGLVVGGTFQATPAAAALTVAEHFQGTAVPVQVRLSNAAGNPLAPDRQSSSTGRALGLGVRFVLPSGAVASWAAVNLPAFPARTPQDFLRLTAAQKPFLSLQPNPFKLVAYLLTRPHLLPTIKAIAKMKPARSFGCTPFNGIHTYFLVDQKNNRQAVRYAWLPRAGIESLLPTESSALPPQYLLAEMRQRLRTGAVQWELQFQFPEAIDSLEDASRAWPAERKTIVAGTLTINSVEPDQKAAEGLVFDPTGVVPGLKMSDDPLLRFRSAVYSESYRRRSQETRVEPPPPDMDQ